MAVQLPQLNFPTSKFTLKEDGDKLLIRDDARRKFFLLTPEEWVRQNCLHYLRDVKHFPISLLAVERGIKVNGQNLRYDIVAYSKKAKPIVLVECKAPEVAINQKTFDQIAVYNMELNVPYLMVSNGLNHFYCKVDFENKKYVFLKELPEFMQIIME